MLLLLFWWTGWLSGSVRVPPTPMQVSDVPAGTVVFQGGFTTNPRDNGRPVALIAAALGVTDKDFRAAFRNVRPSQSGPPAPGRARQNKEVLMAVLSPLGMSNDRLDEVSNYYRYNRARGEFWPYRQARAVATVEDGRVTGITITERGFGYTVAPTVMVAGYFHVQVHVEMGFGMRLESNGCLQSLTLAVND